MLSRTALHLHARPTRATSGSSHVRPLISPQTTAAATLAIAELTQLSPAPPLTNSIASSAPLNPSPAPRATVAPGVAHFFSPNPHPYNYLPPRATRDRVFVAPHTSFTSTDQTPAAFRNTTFCTSELSAAPARFIKMNQSKIRPLPLAAIILIAAASIASAADAPKPLQFNRDIRPILADTCFKCHGFDKKARKADLRLDLPDEAYKSRKSGSPIVPGHPEQSQAWLRLSTHDPEQLMPPPKSHLTLTDLQKATLKAWIEQGAAYQPHWAFIPPKDSPVPDVAEPTWPRNPIDAFILARLQAEDLHHSPEADKRTLIRRVTLDLTGLPPTPRRSHDFLADNSNSRLREGRRSPARLAALRPAHGDRLARRRPLRRHQRLPGRPHAHDVALARLGRRRHERQHALRPVHRRPDRRRSAPQRHPRPAPRLRLQSQPHLQRRRRRASPKKTASTTSSIASIPPPPHSSA